MQALCPLKIFEPNFIRIFNSFIDILYYPYIPYAFCASVKIMIKSYFLQIKFVIYFSLVSVQSEQFLEIV